MFITFEGIEGCGKSTQIQLLYAHLRQRGHTVVLTREPGGTALGDEIRRLLLHRHDTVMDNFCEFLLYLASRAQHVSQVIKPALEAGHLVLCDRFSAATLAYQGYARGLDLQMITEMDAVARQGILPNKIILLDCPADVGLERIARRSSVGQDRLEKEVLSFHERVRQGYLELAQKNPGQFAVVNATLELPQVQQEIIRLVEKIL